MNRCADDLRASAARAWPAHDWSPAIVASGAFHDVVVRAPHVAARIAGGRGHRRRVSREAVAVRIVAGLELPFLVPQVLGDPVTRAGRTGLLTTFVAGQARLSASWPQARAGVAAALDAFRAVPEHRCAGLPAPRTWCGGDGWDDVVRSDLVSRLPTGARATAVAVVDDVLAVERDADRSFVHGDVGLHNLLWSGDRPTGLIDADHACWGDPAMDVAPLVGTFGAARVAQIAPPELVQRALYHRASLPLQVAAAAQLIGDCALRDHALRNFATRVAERTLYDPNGMRPSG